MDVITPAQCRAARALLNWSQPDLARRCGVHVQTISNFEHETSTPTKTTLTRIALTLANEGVELGKHDGVKRKSSDIATFKGKEGFALFRLDVLEAAQRDGADICISNLDERLFDKWGEGDVNDNYRNAMAEIRKTRPGFKFRSLSKKGDTHFSAHRHSEYRWVDPEQFGEFPFYIYGTKTAMILFERDNIEIFVINHPVVTGFFRAKFEKDWSRAEQPDTPPNTF
ncbi:MAG: helix-turn-helix transcriptional regulator [Alphaproteobacteria bacterium]|nr:helix-turn-helix transcriptional regulator [Alphaproteobacteria bacterium]